jgi:ATP-dependent DNA helicase RecG
MVILDAHCFGLATLHQLRGRIGRNSLNNQCLLVSGANDNERLKLLKQYQDGFTLAEFDLKMRGYSDLLNNDQTGFIDFEYLDLESDEAIITLAQTDVKKIINDPTNRLFNKYFTSKIS